MEDSPVKVTWNFLFPLYEAFDVGRTVVIGSQGSSKIVKIGDQLAKVVNPHSYVEKRIKKGAISAPFDTHLLSD